MIRMLIADDNEAITKILAGFARREGYEVTTVADGAAALAEFARRPYDIVLLDVMMPKKDGFAVCRELRTASNVPILMITARGEDYDRIMGLDIGADDYIVKPFSAAEVMARVRAVLRRLERTTAEAGAEALCCWPSWRCPSLANSIERTRPTSLCPVPLRPSKVSMCGSSSTTSTCLPLSKWGASDSARFPHMEASIHCVGRFPSSPLRP